MPSSKVRGESSLPSTKACKSTVTSPRSASLLTRSAFLHSRWRNWGRSSDSNSNTSFQTGASVPLIALVLNCRLPTLITTKGSLDCFRPAAESTLTETRQVTGVFGFGACFASSTAAFAGTTTSALAFLAGTVETGTAGVCVTSGVGVTTATGAATGLAAGVVAAGTGAGVAAGLGATLRATSFFAFSLAFCNIWCLLFSLDTRFFWALALAVVFVFLGFFELKNPPLKPVVGRSFNRFLAMST
mmetsp:Transcript_9309/g.10525  ORF Transcript_9309/g.10525 Transcript_9309/m.10525 type:complete len:244 (+) Transcript_9309:745-1476(+)